MAGPWDDLMKLLIKTKPQHIVQWVWKGAIAKHQLSEELKSTIYADGLFLVEENAKEFLVHVEVQSTADPRIGERLQEYNVLASREHGYLPVYSCVVYLRKGINIVSSPFIRKLHTGQEISRLYFGIIEVAEIPVERFLQVEPTGLLPLVPLTNGGTKREAVDTMITRLVAAKEQQLLAISYLLGSLAFQGEDAQRWFRERFRMFEHLIQDTWIYNEVGREFFEKGIEEGIQKGIEQGEIRALRQVVLDIIGQRFPEMEAPAKKFIETLRTSEPLRSLILKLNQAQTPQDAALALLMAGNDSPTH